MIFSQIFLDLPATGGVGEGELCFFLRLGQVFINS